MAANMLQVLLFMVIVRKSLGYVEFWRGRLKLVGKRRKLSLKVSRGGKLVGVGELRTNWVGSLAGEWQDLNESLSYVVGAC
jgi:hypothetical protein